MRDARRRKSSNLSGYAVAWCLLAALPVAMASEVKTEVDLPQPLMDRYEVLIAELRCPKCLNINIADSNAPIATDLRMVVAKQLKDGNTNQEIKAYLRERYGDFIDYDPPITPGTLALWALPIVMLLCAAVIFTYVGFRRQKLELTAEERTRLARLKARQES